jgi:hypothetical protein
MVLFLLITAVIIVSSALAATLLPDRLLGLAVPIGCVTGAIFLSFVLTILLHYPQG